MLYRGSGAVRTAFVAVLVALAQLLVAVPHAAAYDDNLHVRIITLNDFHGALGLDRVDDPSTSTDEDAANASAAELATAIEVARAQAGEENSVLFVAGDSIGGSNWYVSAISRDFYTVELLNSIGVDASALGNHELDRGLEWLETNVIHGASGYAKANFPILAANVWHGDGSPAFPAWVTVPAAGLRVCAVGAVTPETRILPPAPLGDLVIGDPVEAVNRVVAELEARRDCDLTVAVFHEGGALDGGRSLEEQFAAVPLFKRMVLGLDPSVDALVTGHRHQRQSYVVQRSDRAPLAVVQAGEFGRAIGLIDLHVDRVTREVVRVSVETRESTKEADHSFTRVVAAADVEARAQAVASEMGSVKIATARGPITRAWQNGRHKSGAFEGGPFADVGSESTVGHLLADALYRTVPEAPVSSPDLGIIAESSIKGDIPLAGDVTVGAAYRMFPDELRVCYSSVTGRELLAVLEQQWRADSSVSRLAVSSNVQVRALPATAPGARVGVVLVDGVILDPLARYLVATDNITCRGLYGFTAMRAGMATYPALSGRELFIERYLKVQRWISPDVRTRQVETDLPLSATAGERVRASIHGLNLSSTGSPRHSRIKLFLSTRGGNRLLDTSPVSGGVASISATSPATGNLVALAYPSQTVLGVALAKWHTRIRPRRIQEFLRDRGVEIGIVSPLSATGTVRARFEGERRWRTAAVSEGVASIAVPRRRLLPGRHLLHVRFSGSATHRRASGSMQLVVRRLQPELVVRARLTGEYARLAVRVDTDRSLKAHGALTVRWGGRQKVARLIEGRSVFRLPRAELRNVRRLKVSYSGSDKLAPVMKWFAPSRI